jgi:hypothetical protein
MVTLTLRLRLRTRDPKVLLPGQMAGAWRLIDAIAPRLVGQPLPFSILFGPDGNRDGIRPVRQRCSGEHRLIQRQGWVGQAFLRRDRGLIDTFVLQAITDCGMLGTSTSDTDPRP